MHMIRASNNDTHNSHRIHRVAGVHYRSGGWGVGEGGGGGGLARLVGVGGWGGGRGGGWLQGGAGDCPWLPACRLSVNDQSVEALYGSFCRLNSFDQFHGEH